MANPIPYERTYSFTDYQASNPSAPLPGLQVDNELENVETSLGQAIDAIKDVRRSDGALKNGIVTIDSLDATVAAGVGAGALASAEAAAASADAASDSAVAAAASATAAGISETAASGYASNALTSRNEASGFSDDSAAAASLSQTARDFAKKWATEAEGVDVNDGVNPVGKSAFHWAQVALAASAASVPDGSITTAKLANGALSADATGRAKMADGFVTSTKIADGTIATGDLADGAVTTAKLADGSVTSAKIGTNQVTPDKQAGEHFRGYIYGLTLSNNGTDANNDIDISSGSAGSDGATPVLMTLASGITKRLDASWAVGTGNGGLDTGSKANSTWYYAFEIQRSDTGVTDVLLSASPTSPTMPTNYDRKRRLPGAIRTDGSGNIVAFKQYPGRRFIYATPSADINTTITTTASTHSVLTPPIQVTAILNLRIAVAGAAITAYFSGPDQTDAAPNNNTNASLITDNMAGGSGGAGQFLIDTATSLIRARSTSTGTTFTGQTLGFIDQG